MKKNTIYYYIAGAAAAYFLLFKRSGISGYFDTSVIQSLDELKKQYFKLAKIYHPDAGGTTRQFQDLQAEYERLFQKILKGGNLSQEDQDNETAIDETIRSIIDEIIKLPGLNIEIVGKWLWVSGDTKPVKDELKAAGLSYIKKEGKSYWIFAGTKVRKGGQLSMEEIKSKYGATSYASQGRKSINGRLNYRLINKLKKLQILLKNR